MFDFFFENFDEEIGGNAHDEEERTFDTRVIASSGTLTTHLLSLLLRDCEFGIAAFIHAKFIQSRKNLRAITPPSYEQFPLIFQ